MGAPIGLAPIFDNGRALFPNVAENDASQFELESHMRGPAFGGSSFEELLSRIVGPRQIELLERAAQRGIVGNVLAPGRRVAALDAFVRRRASELATIRPVDHAELVEALNAAIKQRAFPDDGSYRLPASA